MLKKELRKIYLARQRRLTAAEREEKSRRIRDLFFRNFDLGAVRVLHCFLPIAKFNEIDTMPILQKIWRDFPGTQTLVPRVNFQTGLIENLPLTSVTGLVPNRWLIPEPASGQQVASKTIDLVLVPLLCCDRRGYRAGYGKGFYDKFLAGCRTDCLKIGLSYFAPVPEIRDVDEYDIKLDFCAATEKLWKF